MSTGPTPAPATGPTTELPTVARPAPAGAKGAPAGAEERFCQEWMNQRDAVVVHFTGVVTIFTHAASLVLLPLFADPSVIRNMITLHAVSLVLLVIGVIGGRRRPAIGVATVTVVMVLVIISYEVLLHYAATTLRTSRDVLLCSAGVMAYTAGGLQLFPKRGVAMVLFAVFLAAFSFWATTDIQAGIIWSTIYSSFVGFCLAIHMMMDFRLKREARREFRFRSQVAPAHIVRRCTSETEDLAAMFRAEQKYCVCISTDWRNYQELSASLSPQELSGILNAYYDLAHELLERSFPEGNFFTDWVADELFVVVFETAAGEGGRLVDVAMTFASDLLAAKDRFYRRHGLPRAVDVGIAAGDAVLGLLGPNGLRKATAVGQTPGRARRLQSAGKLLRRSYGEGDRIIFGRECLMQLKGSLDVVEVELAEGQSIRDLKDRELYFVQPFPNFPNKDAAGNPEAESA